MHAGLRARACYTPATLGRYMPSRVFESTFVGSRVGMVPVKPSLAMGFYFFPRGGSAQVARYLCRALRGSEYEPTLFAGSMGPLPRARTLTSSSAASAANRSTTRRPDRSGSTGGDAMAAPVPMPASYEDKPGVPDRIFFDLDAAAFDRQVASWTRFFKSPTLPCVRMWCTCITSPRCTKRFAPCGRMPPSSPTCTAPS